MLSFHEPRLARRVETLLPEQIDALPFGAVRLDPNGKVLLYSRSEALQSGYGDRTAVGRLFFTDVAPCMNCGYFKGRIDRARATGTLDIEFTFIGDFSDQQRELTVRVQSASDGGMWIFIQRDTVGGR